MPLALEAVPIAKESLIRAESSDIYTQVTGSAKTSHF